MKYYSPYFGQAYGQGSYGNGTYSCTTQQQQNGTCTAAAGGGTSGSGTGSNSSLTNTGIAVATIVTLACLIVFVSLIVRIWRRKPAVQEVPVQAETEDQTDQQR